MAIMLKKLDTVWRFLGHGLHVLTFVLVVIAGLNDGINWALVLFAVIYIAGVWLRPAWLWLLLVVVAWVCFLYTSPTAAFVAFPLFFLCIGILPMRRAIPAVVVITAIAVYALGRFNGWTVGGVIGPVTGAMVAIALGVGFRMLRRETAAAERMRLAGEIHDTVAQGLSSIHMLLHSVEAKIAQLDIPAEDKRVLAEQIGLARSTAESNLEETRRIIASLQPQQLDQMELQVAIGSVVAGTPMGEDLHYEVDGSPYAVAPDMQRELLRIAQSLVSNVVKHSHASSARVTLSYLPDVLVLDVVDNGRGMDLSNTEWSPVGLEWVEDRAARFGGAVIVESAPGQGCGVSVHLPIENRTSKEAELWSE